jgi:hypothetical protein
MKYNKNISIKIHYIIGLPMFSDVFSYSLNIKQPRYTGLSAAGEHKLQVSADELSKQKCSPHISYEFTCLELPNAVTALLLTFVNKS